MGAWLNAVSILRKTHKISKVEKVHNYYYGDSVTDSISSCIIISI